MPISGFGLHQSLIRFGSLSNDEKEKKAIFLYVFKRGVLASILLISIILASSFFINFQFESTRFFINILSFLILPYFTLEIIKAFFRLKHQNKLYAWSEVVFNVTFVLSVYILSYFFKEIGYSIALIVPFIITSLMFLPKLNINFKQEINIKYKTLSFWKYGFFTSLSNVATQLLFAIDILLIGYYLKNAEMVTNYRYISLIPFSLLFLPRVFITTDFVSFTEKIYDKDYIRNYIKSYILFFSIISFFLFIISFLFSNYILLFLGKSFLKYDQEFLILIIGVIGIYILRGLFGNLLSSIGKAHINFYIALFGLLINVISNFYLIPIYGIKGAAITSTFLMWFTGILSLFLFKINYRRLLLKQL